MVCSVHRMLQQQHQAWYVHVSTCNSYRPKNHANTPMEARHRKTRWNRSENVMCCWHTYFWLLNLLLRLYLDHLKRYLSFWPCQHECKIKMIRKRSNNNSFAIDMSYDKFWHTVWYSACVRAIPVYVMRNMDVIFADTSIAWRWSIGNRQFDLFLSLTQYVSQSISCVNLILGLSVSHASGSSPFSLAAKECIAVCTVQHSTRIECAFLQMI